MSTRAFKKFATGISGLDSITRGGLPAGRCTLLLGGPGCGKTVLALQTLAHAARLRSEPGIFVAFEERSEAIIANAESFGWEIPELIKRNLFFLDAKLPADSTPCGQFDLTGILAGLKAKALEMGARWIVFDAIDVLLSLLDNQILEIRELHRLRDWLAETGLTGIITAKLDDTEKASRSRYSNLQFLADCVLRLEHRLHEQVSLRELRVVKYRGSGFFENLAYYVLGPTGFEVADVNTSEEFAPASFNRISSGVDRLDTMLAGGYYQGSAVLITGLPGTAKTTLSCAFAQAACQRGEKVLYVAFDEPPSEIVRNLTSVGIILEPHIEKGLLKIVGTNTDIGSSEEHLLRIMTMIEHEQPNNLIIDPITTLFRAGGSVLATSVARRLVNLIKRKGMTMLITSLQETGSIELEAKQMHISTIADTWVHLTYHESAGERNRALSIIKSRGAAHSNQLRELILSHDGVSLADVYNTAGAVLMGTLRWEAEQKNHRDCLYAKQVKDSKRRQAQLALEDAEARIKMLHNEILLRKADLEILDAESRAVDQSHQEELSKRNQLRGADFNINQVR